MTKKVFVVFLLTAIIGCATGTKYVSQTKGGKPPALTQDLAATRAKQVGHVSYTLWFGLDDTHKDFEGRAIINFDLKKAARESHELLIDFEGAAIQSMNLNGNRITDIGQDRYDGHRITLKTSELTVGMNRLEVSYSHPYSTDGTGLHRSKDPADGEIYLYTHLEPFDANRVFPCFDQPDIKATYEVTVESPDHWEVITNTREREVSKVDGRKSWAFPPSPVFSTYLFALIAGPYKHWKSEAHGIPLRLFARQSVAKYVDANEWFNVTGKGLEYFAMEFGYPYPFSKYDQIIAPDYNSGGMENVGAVTYSEKAFINRTPITQDRKHFLHYIMMHELAHMWFGNLVTLKWWNGTWLNEAFATLMAGQAMENALHVKNATQLANFRKNRAYEEDQLVTSHPVEAPVADTEQSKNAFDSITYSKGSAALKQLLFLLGEDDFREGVQRYIQKFAFRNSTIGDFFKMLGEASGKVKDLPVWQQMWFQTAGVNTIKPVWSCASGEETGKSKITQFNIVQSTTDPTETLRAHKTKVALYRKKGDRLESKETTDVFYMKGETPVTELIGKACPDAVFLNQDDFDYVKLEMDPVSLQAFTKSLSKVESPLIRQMTWHTLWEMVVDGKLKAQEFADLALEQLGNEKDASVLATVTTKLAASYAANNSILKYLDEKTRADYQSKLEDLVRKRLQSAAAASDTQLAWFQGFTEIARRQSSLEFADHLLNGKVKLRGFEIDQERRWSLIRTLARNNAGNSRELISKELEKDHSDMGQRAAITAEVSIPDVENKKAWFGRILKTPEPEKEVLPLAQLREAMFRFNVLNQENLTRMWVDPYFEALKAMSSQFKAEEATYIYNFTNLMYPALCENAIIEKTNNLLSLQPNMPTHMIKLLKINRQYEEQCVRARAKTVTSPVNPS